VIALSKFIFILFLTLFLIFSCDAPRINPLDPQNPKSIILNIEGVVKTVSLPRIPIKGVHVYLKKCHKETTTSFDGKFILQTINKKNGWIVFSKKNYSTDSVYINWDLGNNKKINVFLNAFPQLDSNVFSSIVIQKYPNLHDDYLEVIVKLKDNENDIDSVFFENESLEIKKSLYYNIAENYWQRRISTSNLGLRTLDKLIGKTIKYTAKDRNGKIFNIGTTSLKRIIRRNIEFLSPANNLKVTTPFTLRWEKYQPGFDLSFRIEIYKNSIPKELVLIKNINQNAVSCTINDELSNGTYFWRIYCIDEFNNQGSSKPASFTVEN